MIGERRKKMIGGQCIIQIRGVNNEKIEITTTQKNLKKGTFEKIRRAIELQKEIVFEDVIVGKKVSSFSVAFALGDDTLETIRIGIVTVDGSTQGVLSYFYINSNDIIYRL